ncbi:methyl-accepting chemotaxis protein [Alkalicella caledoniensis]|uniref:Methyl-accepting chemotaxis protein n=1 Tax=Alkalicella caledoniensis TaxID=2731377 RepID=A0A7G9W4Y5_ALKCA|nr:methyl-accepting chemotaxis protein [Alkalicella caledoniensis]QNO13747.1 methyl-accepting chemotaxis protein [Alkalicella caledoniensis]
MNISIQWKIIAIVILLVVLPMSFLGYMNYTNTTEILITEFKLTSNQTLDLANNTVNIYLEGLTNSLVSMSKLEEVQRGTESEYYIERMLENFQSVAETYDAITHVYLGTPNKDFYIYPHVELEDYDPTIRPWYVDALARDGLIWTDVYESGDGSGFVVSTAVPIYNSFDNNEFIGVLTFDINLYELQGFVDSIRIGQTGTVALLSDNGTIITHPDRELIGGILPIDELLAAITSNNSGELDFEFQGESRYAVYNTIESTRWKIIGSPVYDEVYSNVSVVLRDLIINAIIAIVIAALLAYLLSFTITKSLKQLVKDLEKISAGDFTVKTNIKSKDEIGTLGKAINQMVDQLGSLLRDIQNVSQQLGMASETLAANTEETTASTTEVSRAAEEIAKGATEQARDVETGSEMTRNLDEKFVELTHGSTEILGLTKEVSSANETGNKAVSELVNANKENNTVTENIERTIIELNNKTQSIGGILETISNISNQTNLLALNAAIEAARAGEAGKGFAVVADEIRKLAEQAGKSTGEIASIVSEIQGESSRSVEIMQKTKEQAKIQNLAVSEVDSAFTTISKSIENITGRIEGITKYVDSMAQDGREIVDVIQRVAAVSEETAASSEQVTASMQQTAMVAEEVAKAAEQLNDLSDKLNQEITKFKI